MNEKYDELMEKLKNAETDQLRPLIGEINEAREADQIDDDERNKLLASAKTLY